MTAPLLVTADETLLDELLRLSAAAGTTPDVAHDVPAALRSWAKAPLVLVGADLAEPLARAAPARRDGVFVVLLGPVPTPSSRIALAVGAESVAELPRSEGWLVERLTDVVDTGPARGLTIGVVGGSGGVGRDDVRLRPGQVAGRSGPAMVVDLDPLGPGVDRVLGLDLVDGDPVGRARPHHRPAQRAGAARLAAPPRRGRRAHLVRRAPAAPSPGVRRPRGAVGRAPRPRHGRRRPAARAGTH